MPESRLATAQERMQVHQVGRSQRLRELVVFEWQRSLSQFISMKPYCIKESVGVERAYVHLEARLAQSNTIYLLANK